MPDQKHLSLPDARARRKQLAAVRALAARHAVSVDEATASFAGARREHVERLLETLALMGEVTARRMAAIRPRGRWRETSGRPALHIIQDA